MNKKGTERIKRLLAGVEKFKYVLLIALVGALLLLWPTDPKETTGLDLARQTNREVSEFDLEEMEQRLSAALSKIEGAGEVTVLLTVQNSPRQILAVDGQESQEEYSTETVVLSKGSGMQETVLVEQIYPDFQGALIICSGADQSGIRLKLVEAVSALTGLGADRISVCKGK